MSAAGCSFEYTRVIATSSRNPTSPLGASGLTNFILSLPRPPSPARGRGKPLPPPPPLDMDGRGPG
eukprot:2013554-Pyramimonas_sp.AAC.1